MYIEKEFLFSDVQDLGSISSAVLSTDKYNLGTPSSPHSAQHPFSGKKKLALVCTVHEAFNTLTALIITLESDGVVTFDDTPTVHLTRTILLADLVLGAKFIIGYVGDEAFEQYLGVRYTVSGTDCTTGMISAMIVETAEVPEDRFGAQIVPHA